MRDVKTGAIATAEAIKTSTADIEILNNELDGTIYHIKKVNSRINAEMKRN